MEKNDAPTNEDQATQGIQPTSDPTVGDLQENNSKNENDGADRAENTAAPSAMGYVSRKLMEWWEIFKSPDHTNHAIAVATVIIAVATVFTFFEMQCGRKLTEKTAMRDSRPWVLPHTFHLTAEPGTGNSVVQFKLNNGGRTPAIDTFYVAVPYLLPEQPSLANYPASPDVQGGSRQVLGRGADEIAETGPVPIGIVSAEYMAGSRRLFVTSKIYYTDTFGIPHWTTMCVYHIWGTGLDNFSFCGAGNDVDRNPK